MTQPPFTYQQWKELTTLGFFHTKTNEFDKLDKAYEKYHAAPSDTTRDDVKQNLSNFIKTKEKEKKIFFNARAANNSELTDRDKNGAITILYNHINNSKKIKEYNRQDLIALQEIKLAHSQVLQRTLSDIRVEYRIKQKIISAKEAISKSSSIKQKLNNLIKSGSEIKETIDKEKILQQANDFKNELKSVLPQTGKENAEKLVTNATPQSADWLSSITEVIGDIPQEVLSHLYQEIGAEVLNEIAGFIPALGVVSDATKIITNTKRLIETQLAISRNDSARFYIASHADIATCIDSIQSIFQGRRNELGLDLAVNVSSTTAGILTAGIASTATNLAYSFAKLFMYIREFIEDYKIIVKINRLLNNKEFDKSEFIDLINKFPFLGAYVITALETSTLISLLVQDLNKPEFQVKVELYSKKIKVLRDSAFEIILESRYVVIKDRAALATRRSLDLAGRNLKSLTEQQVRKIRDYRNDLQWREDATRRVLNDAANSALNRTKLQMRERRQRALAELSERQRARELAEMRDRQQLERQQRELIEMHERQQAHELAKLLAFQEKIKKTIDVYHAQTTGLKNRLTTWQSKESTAAYTLLKSLTSRNSIQQLKTLKATVEYLIDNPIIGAATVDKSIAKLKPLSRLHSLLSSAYKESNFREQLT